jgi:NAD(P)-dependent dehydrogenase (short-subunit alcohol dehydrogenase family)
MKTVLITGANKGVGLETAAQLAALGYFVYLGSRDRERGEKAVAGLRDRGISHVKLLVIDVTAPESIASAAKQVEAESGVLDVLINNAGIAGEMPQHITSVEMENLRNVFETNFFGPVQVTRGFIGLLKKSEAPLVLNVSSELGSLAIHNHNQNPNFGRYDAYSCSKTALNAFTVMLANELREDGFRVNSVTPGFTATDLNHHTGTQSVEEGARAIVNGVTLYRDGATGMFFRDQPVPW